MAQTWIDFAFVREHADFATILSRYGIGHAQNQNQVTVLCPFHDDRRPSLSVNLEGKLFHCFACQAKGDILDFVANIEAVSLIEAAGIVAQCCGIPTEGQSPSRHHSAVKTAVQPMVDRRRGFRNPRLPAGWRRNRGR
jgi:DNA primase